MRFITTSCLVFRKLNDQEVKLRVKVVICKFPKVFPKKNACTLRRTCHAGGGVKLSRGCLVFRKPMR